MCREMGEKLEIASIGNRDSPLFNDISLNSAVILTLHKTAASWIHACVLIYIHIQLIFFLILHISHYFFRCNVNTLAVSSSVIMVILVRAGHFWEYKLLLCFSGVIFVVVFCYPYNKKFAKWWLTYINTDFAFQASAYSKCTA